MACEDFKDLPRRTSSDKVLHGKAFNIPKNSKYDGYQRGLASMVYKVFDKSSSGGAITRAYISAIKSEIMPTQQLAEELHKPIIRKFEKRKVYSSFKDNIWGTDLGDMQLISQYDKRFLFLLYVTDIFSKYTWVAPLKDKKCITIIDAFQKMLIESGRKLKKCG